MIRPTFFALTGDAGRILHLPQSSRQRGRPRMAFRLQTLL